MLDGKAVYVPSFRAQRLQMLSKVRECIRQNMPAAPTKPIVSASSVSAAVRVVEQSPSSASLG